MPFQQFPSGSLLSAAMPASIGGFSAFKFQPRREGVDWRRFSAIDVDRVARELDVATLQENISSITFCSLEAEKCPYCQQPVDPVLLKVLKMAQLTIEYLLHSQEYLSSNMAMMEERIEAAVEEHEHTKQEMGKMAEELKGVKEESKRRKKMLSTQQLLLQAGANNYHKCQLCDKAFMNFSFLQSHVQRRHPEITEAERQKKKQVMQMEDGIEELKANLQKTHAQLEEEREAENHRRMQEQEETRRREQEGKRDFERWKEEERTKFQQEMDSLRQLFLTEFKGIASKNSTLEDKLQELESRKVVVSNLGALQDDDGKRERQLTKKELQALREKIESQKMEWKRKLKDMQQFHQQEKEELTGENERLRASLSKDQRTIADRFQQQIASLSSQIKDQGKVIKVQEEKIRTLSSKKVEVTEAVRPVKPKIEEQESEEEAEEEVSTEEELEDSLDRKQKLLEALRKNPNFIKQFRPILEENLEEKLIQMGVKKDARGIPAQTLRNLKALLQTQQEQKATKLPEIMTLRAKLSKEVTRKVKQWQKSGSTMESQPSMTSVSSHKSPRTPQPQSRRVTPKPRTVQVIETKPRNAEPPKPSPRSSVLSPAISPRTAAPAAARPARLSTPPFTSEEESMIDRAYLTSPKSKQPQSSRPIQPSPKKQDRVAESEDEDWSDTDFSEENDSPMSTGMSAGRTPQGSLVKSMASSLEKQLSGPRKKPIGGLTYSRGPTAISSPPRNVAKKLQVSEDESDLEISSFDEITEQLGIKEKSRPNQAHQPAVRHSADSAGSQGTSIWSSNSTRAGGW